MRIIITIKNPYHQLYAKDGGMIYRLIYGRIWLYAGIFKKSRGGCFCYDYSEYPQTLFGLGLWYIGLFIYRQAK